MTNDLEKDERSRRAGKEIAYTTAKAFKQTPAEITEAFDALQATILGEANNDLEVLEIKRRIAEAKISVLAEKDSDQEFETAWTDMEALGYSDNEREATIIFYRAKFLIENGAHRSLADKAVERLGNLVSAFREQQSRQLADHFGQVYKRLLNELDRKFS